MKTYDDNTGKKSALLAKNVSEASHIEDSRQFISEMSTEKPWNYAELIEMLSRRADYLEKMITVEEQNIDGAPQGKLRISEGKGKVSYYYRRYGEKNGTFIRKDQAAVVNALAQKSYDEKVLTASEKEVKAIRYFLRNLPKTPPEGLYSELPERRRKLIVPVWTTDEDYIQEWQSVAYEGKNIPDDTPEHITDRGERVRSKSEVIIANLLYKNGIPYRYEYPLIMKGIGTIYPDFTVLNVRRRKEILWEHFGMMDDETYAENAVKKEQMYIKHGFLPGDNLILTSETRNVPINVKVVKTIIDRLFS